MRIEFEIEDSLLVALRIDGEPIDARKLSPGEVQVLLGLLEKAIALPAAPIGFAASVFRMPPSLDRTPR